MPGEEKQCDAKTAAKVIGATAAVVSAAVALITLVMPSNDVVNPTQRPTSLSEVLTTEVEIGNGNGGRSPTPPSPLPTLTLTNRPTMFPTSPLTSIQECDDNADCILGACAYESYTGAATKQCCPSGSSQYIYKSSWTGYPKSSNAYFCNGQPAGARCHQNSLCESNTCIFGFCEATPRPANETCQENPDCLSNVCVAGICQSNMLAASEECDDNADCIIGVCAYESYTGAATKQCCPSGSSEYIYKSSWAGYPKSSSTYFCDGQPAGARCHQNSLCESSNCISNTCI